MAAWVLPAAVAGAGVVSSLIGSSSADKASKAAARVASQQLNLQNKMYEEGKAQMKPFYETGINALTQLSGYSPVTTTKELPPEQWTINPEWTAWNRNRQPVTPAGWQPSDIVGPGSTASLPTTTVGPEPPKYINKTGEVTEWQQTQEPFNLTGESRDYMKQLEALDFKLDPEDDIYKWRQEQGEDVINRAMAGRGLHDSTAGLNALLTYNKDLQAAETERQFQQNYMRKYGQLMDLANLSSQYGTMDYNALLDLVKLGYGAGESTGSWAQSTGAQGSNALAALGQTQSAAELAKGNTLANMISGLPINALLAYKIFQPSVSTPPYIPGAMGM